MKKKKKNSKRHISNYPTFKLWRCLLVDQEGLCDYIKKSMGYPNKYTVLWASKSIQIQRWKALYWAKGKTNYNRQQVSFMLIKTTEKEMEENEIER